MYVNKLLVVNLILASETKTVNRKASILEANQSRNSRVHPVRF